MNLISRSSLIMVLWASILSACSSGQPRRLSKVEKTWPDALKNEIRNFVYIPGHTKSLSLENDLIKTDPLVCERQLEFGSFYLMRHEVSIAEYMEFCQWKKDTLNAPDTLCFVRDFAFTDERGLYFWHPYYLQHPVVGVSYTQVCRFLKWKTDRLNAQLQGSGFEVRFRLPTAWELESMLQTWDWHEQTGKQAGRPDYAIYNTGRQWSKEGELIRMDTEDGYLLTAPVYSMDPDDYGLYHIHGNVAEMTSTSYPEFVMQHADSVTWLSDSCLRRYAYPHPPIFSHDSKQTDTVCFDLRDARLLQDTSLMISKGGSWFHSPYYCRPHTILPFRRDAGHSWLGFRMAIEIWYKPVS